MATDMEGQGSFPIPPDMLKEQKKKETVCQISSCDDHSDNVTHIHIRSSFMEYSIGFDSRANYREDARDSGNNE